METQGQGSSGEAPLSPPLSPVSAAQAALATARWNPTKEQVHVLEALYNKGVRTPTAEEIEKITARLKDHGPIEGKNVFYWFQNHKARQRQKQKQQDSFAYFSRLLRKPPPLPVMTRPHFLPPPPGMVMVPPPPPPPGAACNNGGNPHVAVMLRPPCYMTAPQAAAANAAYYHAPAPQQEHMAVLYPRQEVAQDRMIRAAEAPPVTMYQQAPPPATMYQQAPQHFSPASGADAAVGVEHVGPRRQMLQLFPLQPTFVLPDKARGGSASLVSNSPASASWEPESHGSPSSNGEALPYYDFMGVHSGGGR